LAPVPQPPLQRETLGPALVRLAQQVQRATHLEEALRVAGEGLEALGFDVAIVEQIGDAYRSRHLTRRPELAEVAKASSPARGFPVKTDAAFEAARARGEAMYVAALPEATARWLEVAGVTLPPTTLAAVMRARAVVAPLSVDENAWGAAAFMHDDLVEADTALLGLFALQLGSCLGVVDRADRRTAELELVHRLAAASTRTEVVELCKQALEAVCRITGSDAGALHRFEREGQRFVLLGDVFGYQGPLAATWRTFTLPDEPSARRPQSLSVRAMPAGAAPVLAEGFEQAAVVPLMLEEQRVGFLSLFRRASRPYAAAELRSAEVLGLQMASVLERQRLYQDSQRLYADLKASYDELARAQAELVRHERLAALGELAAVMAHEVRNPLGVIFNSLTTLKRLTRPTGDAEMLLNMVGEEADRLNRIVADLLDFARPYELVKKPIAVEPFIAGAIDAATQTLQTSVPVKVVTSFDKELPPFPLDAHLMRQALINLVVNAAQAMPRGGLVSVSARVERAGAAPWLVIEVCDEGLGLSARATEKIFQPFFTTKATGTGLGLAVVKRIVDSHGGEVTARANAERGTTFVVRLPGGSEREGVMTPPRPSPSAPR
jgi:signal transduction histidine kinase